MDEKRQRWTVVKSPAVNPDLNPAEHLWKEPKTRSWEKAPIKAERSGAVC